MSRQSSVLEIRRRFARWNLVVVGVLAGCGAGLDEPEEKGSAPFGAVRQAIGERAPNNLPMRNPGGHAATFSVEGSLDLANEFHTPQGTNGRDCASCHVPEDGWSIRPETVQRFFDETDGAHPIFNIIDANTPTSDVSTVEAKRRSYSMLLQGKFIRLRSPPANAEFEVIAAQDPFAFGTTKRLLFFRRPLPTANFASQTVMWDGANTVVGDLHAGLSRQARGNVTGAQQGPPASPEVIKAIVDYELGLFHAQLIAPGVGRLDSDAARGGPEALAAQPLVAGRFDLFDAWADHRNPRRAQIARGQELFNRGDRNGNRCGGCHNAANNGQNVAGTLFDIGASSPAFKKPDMAVYTLRRLSTGETRETTDPGLGFVSGRWADVNRFKTPNLRGLAARAPYFHNGVADSLHDVVRIYEESRGFDFTPEEEEDLVAFLGAL